MASNYTSSGGPPISEAMYNGGTQLGQALTCGTADNYAFSLITNGTVALSIDTSQNVTFTGSVTPTGVFLAPNGAVGAPSFSFASDTDTGLFRAGANELAVTCGGTQQVSWLGSQYLAVGGATASAPHFSFSGDGDTGFYRLGANDVGIATNGALSLEVKGLDVVVGNAAVATSATSGFLWLPACAGAATGTPANTFTGRTPIVFDSTNGRLYAYYGGAWKYAAVAT